jgi:hypothetical protein
LFYFGFAVYLWSFFLTAVGNLLGWDCAIFSLLSRSGPDDKISPLAMFGGLINPQIIIFAALAAGRIGKPVRSVLAVGILICIPLSWIAIYQMSAGMTMNIGPGHILWLAGILLMIFPDIPVHSRLPKSPNAAPRRPI